MPHPIEPCPCGSLKLYKDCCGRKGSQSSRAVCIPAIYSFHPFSSTRQLPYN